MLEAEQRKAEEEVAVKESLLSRTFLSLQYRNFRLLWLGSITEHAGEHMDRLALSWLVWEKTESALSVAFVNTFQGLPLLLVPFLGGVLADRLNRRHLLRLTLLAFSVSALVLLLVTLAGDLQVWHIYLYAAFTGSVIGFNHPARASLVPNLVRREHLMNAISLDSVSVSASRILLLPAAGYIMKYLGTEAGVMTIFGLKAFLNLVALAWLQMLEPPPTPKRPPRKPWRELGDGVRYSAQNKTILSLQFLFIVPLLFLGPVQNVLLPAFADKVLHIGVEGFGLLQGITGAAAIAGILAMATLGDYRGKGRLFFALALATSLFFLAFSFSPWIALSFPVLFLAIFAQSSKDTVWNTVMQSNIPDEVRGRVMSVRETIRGAMPLGTLMVGALADALGAPKALTILALTAGFVMLGAAFFLPRVRRLQ